MIRRNNSIGHHYFIANLTGKDITSTVALAVNEKNGMRYNPMTGKYHKATIGDKGIKVNLKSGESRILITSDKPVNEWKLGSKVKRKRKGEVCGFGQQDHRPDRQCLESVIHRGGS